MIKGPGPTPTLPSRLALKELDKTQRTIVDYAKATPLLQTDVEPASILQMMRKPNAG
jgi:hypothetical protein